MYRYMLQSAQVCPDMKLLFHVNSSSPCLKKGEGREGFGGRKVRVGIVEEKSVGRLSIDVAIKYVHYCT